VVVDAVRPQSDCEDQGDLRAIIQELRVEVNELKARVHEIQEAKKDSDFVVADLHPDMKEALEDSPKHILADQVEKSLVEGVVDIQSKNKPATHQIPAEAKHPRTEPAPNSRIRYRTSKLNSNGTRTERDGTPPSLQNVTDGDADIAFEAKEIFNKEGRITSYETTLKSKKLRSVIWKVIGSWLLHERITSRKTWEDNNQVWTSPFLYVMHYWTEFEIEANDAKFQDDQGHQDLKELLLYIETVCTEEVNYRRRLEILEKIPYRYLWMLFRPGSLIVTKPDPELIYRQVLQVHAHRFSTERSDGERVVIAWAFDWNGSELVRRYFEFPLGRPNGNDDETPIRDLQCWPIRYMYRDHLTESDEESEAAIRDALVERGQKMREHCVLKSGKHRMCNFEGVVQFVERQPAADSDDRFSRTLRFTFPLEPKSATRKVRAPNTTQRRLADVSADN
jgi:hypothetical protein